MAQLVGNIPWIGSLGTLTAYKRKDSDKIILRAKRRPMSEEEKKSEDFFLTRLNNSEFSGRSKASSSIMFAMNQLKRLADYNVAGPLNALLRPIQLADSINEKGKRSVLLSKHASLLNGFNFNRKYTFDSIIRTPVSFTIDKESLSAKIIIPELRRGINLYIPNNYPLYGFTVNLGLVPDFVFKTDQYQAVDEKLASFEYKETEWFPSAIGSKETALELKLTKPNVPSSYTLMLGIGVLYGTLGESAVIDQVKYIGNAKLIGTLGVY